MNLVEGADSQFLVKKIAILNPYLQGGHVQIAETESATRYIEAAKNLGITAKMFANSDSLDEFEPDIVVAITYQEGKLSKYPTYVSLNVPPSLIRGEKRFVRNILSFDGYLTLSKCVITWLESLCRDTGKAFHYTNAAFSVPKTPYVYCDFRNATAMYMGTNWDGNRHSHFFNALDGGRYLTCYGPEKSWLNYKNGLYGGEIPFDGESVIKQYRAHGIGLCIGHPAFDAEGIANNRLFEVPAASALVICAENSLARQHYGDAALYMDYNLGQSDYADQFISYVEWIRSNPKIAAEMARETNDLYNSKLCMEQQILNLIDLHKSVLKNKFNQVESDVEEGKLDEHKSQARSNRVYFVMPQIIEWLKVLPLLQDIKNQTYQNIVLIFYGKSEYHKTLIEEFYRDSRCIREIKFYNGISEVEEYLTKYSADTDGRQDWVALLSPNVRLFSNHVTMLLCGTDSSLRGKKTNFILKAKFLECSDYYHLPDFIQDVHKIYDENNIRLGSSELNALIPITTVLFSLSEDAVLPIKSLCALEYLPKHFLLNRQIVNIEEVTASINVDGYVAKLGYKPLDRLKDTLSCSENRELFAYIDHLKETIWQQEKRIKSIYATKSWLCTFPFRRLSSLVDSFIKKLRVLALTMIAKMQSNEKA